MEKVTDQFFFEKIHVKNVSLNKIIVFE